MRGRIRARALWLLVIAVGCSQGAACSSGPPARRDASSLEDGGDGLDRASPVEGGRSDGPRLDAAAWDRATPDTSRACTHHATPTGSAGWASCGSASTPCSLATASANATAGNVVCLAGVFNASIVPAHDGTSSQPIVFQRAPGQSMPELAPSSGKAVDLTGRKHITVSGLKIRDTSSFWVYLHGNAQYNTIDGCVFYHAENVYQGIRVENAQYNRITNSTFQTAPTNAVKDNTAPADAITVYGDSHHNVIAYNTFGDYGHYAINLNGQGDASAANVHHNVIRGNVIANHLHANLDVWRGSHDILVEDNTIKESGLHYQQNPETTAAGWPRIHQHGLQVGCTRAIVRRNLFVDNGAAIAGGATRENGANSSFNDNRFYGNTFVDNVTTVLIQTNNTNPLFPGATSARNHFINNLHVRRGSPSGAALEDYHHYWRPYESSTYDSAIHDNHFRYNLYTTDAGFNYRGLGTLSSLQSQLGSTWSASFVSASPGLNPDYTLATTSPARNAGGWLTTITSPSAGGVTSFEVVDGSYFYDGWAIPGEVGDTIRTQSGKKTTITSRSGNSLTVSPAIPILSGEGVALDYRGTRPDIGAREYVE